MNRKIVLTQIRACIICKDHFKITNGRQITCSKKCSNKNKSINTIKRVNKNTYSCWEQYIASLLRFKGRRHLRLHDVNAILINQKYTCALSGMQMNYERNSDYIASLDRIDNNKGYEYSNIRFVCKCVNVARNSMTDWEYIRVCQKVVKHNG